MSSRLATLSLGLSLCMAGGCHRPVLVAAQPKAPAKAAALQPPRPATPLPPAAPKEPLPAAAKSRIALPGGALLVLERDRMARTVAVAAFIATGAAEEPLPGTRHLLERLLLDGETAAGAQAARLRSRGSEVVSFTTPDYTTYQIVTPRPQWTAGLELVRKLFDAPPLDEAALSRQRRGVHAELSAASGDGPALRQLLSAAYPGHPYQHPLLGTAESLDTIRAADLQAFHRRHYRPEHLTLVVVGDVEAEEVVSYVTGKLAAWPAEPAAQEQASAPPASRPPKKPAAAAGPRVVSVEGAAPQAKVLLGFAIPPARSADLPALEIAAALLGGDAGRPFSETRSFLVCGREPGVLVVAASAPSTNEAAQSAVLTALRLGQREVLAAELERARQVQLLSSALRSDTPGGRAQRLGSFALLGVDEAAYEARLRRLTPAALRATLARYLTPENLTLAAVTSRRPAEEERLSALVTETAAAAAAATAKEPPSPPLLAAATPGKALLYRLRSGARLAVLPNAEAKTVALTALWPGGRQLEDERSAGLHELLARVWPARQTAGVQLDARVEPHSFGLRTQLLGSDLSEGLAALRACLEYPSLSEADVERGRRDLLIRLGAREDSALRQEAEASRTAWRLFHKGMLGTQLELKQPTEQSLAGLTRRRLVDFYRQHYPREKLVLAVVGAVDPAALLDELSPWLGAATPLEPPEANAALKLAEAEAPVQPVQQTQAFQLVPGQRAHLVVGFRAPGAYAPQRAAAEVLLELLVGDEGRLRRALLLRRGLAYTLEGQLDFSLSTGPGYLALYLTAAPQKLEAAEATLRDELHRLADHPAELAEVEAAREQLLARWTLPSQRRSDRAWQLSQAVALGGPDRALGGSDWETRLLAVDAAAVQALAKEVLREEQMVRAGAIPATRQPLFAMLPAAPDFTLTRYRTNAKNVVSRSAELGDERRDGARSGHLPDGRRGRALSGRVQSVSGHAPALRRKARH